MRRRAFIGLVGAAVSWPFAARAQPTERMRRVGVLIGTKQGDPEGMARLAAFTKNLADLGWANGSNVRIHVGWLTGDADLIRSATTEMVALKPDVIFAATTPVVAALQKT